MSGRSASFARHAREQRERWLALTPEERLMWLERAKRFEQAARAAREGTPASPSHSPDPSTPSKAR